MIRLPLTQTSEIYTDVHTSAEISQEFPLIYFGTKIFHIDFVAAEIVRSVQCVTGDFISEANRVENRSLAAVCVGQPVEAGVSMLQVLACCRC